MVAVDDPCSLPAAKLRKVASQHGISPIGTQDEILTSLITHFEATNHRGDGGSNKVKDAGPIVSNSSESAPEKSASGTMSGVAVAEEVLRCGTLLLLLLSMNAFLW